jgi:uncharacterized protein YcfJ
MGRLFGIEGLLACGIGLTGCEAMGTAAQSKTVQGAVTGGALGAGTGAVIGHQAGKAGEGAAVGAAVGALGGGLVGHALEERQPEAPSIKGRVKFCPVGGELYSEDVKYCPEHGVELKYEE